MACRHVGCRGIVVRCGRWYGPAGWRNAEANLASSLEARHQLGNSIIKTLPTRIHPLPVPPCLLLSPLVWYTMTSNLIGASVSPSPSRPAYPVLTRRRQANIAPTSGPSTTTQVPGTQPPAATPQSVDPKVQSVDAKVQSVDSKTQAPAAAAANAQDGAQAPPKPYYKFNVKMTCSGCSGAIDRVLKKNITSRTPSFPSFPSPLFPCR